MSSETEIHPFRVDMPEDAITDLRRRITATGRQPKQVRVPAAVHRAQHRLPVPPAATSDADRSQLTA